MSVSFINSPFSDSNAKTPGPSKKNKATTIFLSDVSMVELAIKDLSGLSYRWKKPFSCAVAGNSKKRSEDNSKNKLFLIERFIGTIGFGCCKSAKITKYSILNRYSMVYKTIHCYKNMIFRKSIFHDLTKMAVNATNSKAVIDNDFFIMIKGFKRV